MKKYMLFLFAVLTAGTAYAQGYRVTLHAPGYKSGITYLTYYMGNNFNIADSLVTNFHLPKTSLLIMACAFAGYDLMMEAYKKAIKDKYRFFTYGDAMLII